MRHKLTSVAFARLAFLKRFKFILLAGMLAGCGGPVRDTDPRIGALINQCFATAKETIFISGNCQGVDGWSYCDTVKALNREQQRVASYPLLPPTLRAFSEDSEYWSEQIRAQQKYFFGWHGEHPMIYGGLPAGTSLEIVQVSRWFNGENGTFWVAHANIRNGEFKGRRILLPWEGYGQRGWIREEYDPKAKSRMAPEVESDYLSKCESTATAPHASHQ